MDVKEHTASGRKSLIDFYTVGQRGQDGLTNRERLLLAELRQLGYEIQRIGQFGRYIRRKAASPHNVKLSRLK